MMINIEGILSYFLFSFIFAFRDEFRMDWERMVIAGMFCYWCFSLEMMIGSWSHLDEILDIQCMSVLIVSADGIYVHHTCTFPGSALSLQHKGDSVCRLIYTFWIGILFDYHFFVSFFNLFIILFVYALVNMKISVLNKRKEIYIKNCIAFFWVLFLVLGEQMV